MNSNEAASSSASAVNTVPVLSLSGMAAINKVSLSKPLPSAGTTPHVRFQLDSNKSSSTADHDRNALGSADAEAPVTFPLSAISSPPENGFSQGTVGLVRSRPENEKNSQAVADSLADGATSFVDIQSLLEGGSTAVHGASSAQNSEDLEKEEVVCSVQLGGDLHQELCTNHIDCAKSLSEQNHIAAMIERMRRRITVAEFQFAHAGYAARQALNAVHE